MCKRVWYCGCVVECCESNYGQNDIYHEASVHRCSKCGTERPPGAYGDSQREWSEVCCSRCGLSRPQEPERGLYYPNATLTVAERANLTAYTLLLVASSLLFLASFLVTAWCLVAIAQAPLPFSEYPFSDRFIFGLAGVCIIISVTGMWFAFRRIDRIKERAHHRLHDQLSLLDKHRKGVRNIKGSV